MFGFVTTGAIFYGIQKLFKEIEDKLNPNTKLPRLSIHRESQAAPDFMAERLQLQRERDQRLDITARSDCRKQYAHQNPPVTPKIALFRKGIA